MLVDAGQRAEGVGEIKHGATCLTCGPGVGGVLSSMAERHRAAGVSCFELRILQQTNSATRYGLTLVRWVSGLGSYQFLSAGAWAASRAIRRMKGGNMEGEWGEIGEQKGKKSEGWREEQRREGGISGGRRR